MLLDTCRSPTALKRPDRSKLCHCLQFAKCRNLFLFTEVVGQITTNYFYFQDYDQVGSFQFVLLASDSSSAPSQVSYSTSMAVVF